MLIDPPIEELLPRTQNRYTLAITIARRTRQLVDGAMPLVEESEDNPNLVTLACKELAADKIGSLPGDLDPYIPLRPELEEALRKAQEESDAKDMLPSNYTPLAEEPDPAPVSKIRVMDPDEVFLLPDEAEAVERKEAAKRIQEVVEEDEDDDEDEDIEFSADEEEEIDLDEDLDDIDGSIDDEPEDEEDL